MMEPAPSIGLARLASIVIRAGHDVQVIDAYSDRLSVAQCLKIIEEEKPDIVGISVLTPSAVFAEALSRQIRTLAHPATIIMGNVHASFFAETYIQDKIADVVVSGEAEDIFSRLLTAVEQGRPLDDIDGITFRDHDAIRRTEPTPTSVDLDSLPWPAWELFPYHKYGLLPFVTIKKPALLIEGSRGCPFNCSFCCLKNLGRGYRKRSAVSIVDEMDWLVERFKARQVAFADAVFPLTENQGLEFCEVLKDRIHDEFVWVTETRVDLLTDRLAKAMKDTGCTRILFGVESGSQNSLDSVDKKIRIKNIIEAIKTCKRHGIQTAGFFILGFPEEDAADIDKTIQLSLSLPLDIAKFNLLIPYPGTEIYENAHKENKLNHYNWEDYSCYLEDPDRLPLSLSKIPAEQLLLKQQEATRRFYFRPGMIIRHLFVIRSVPLYFLLLAGKKFIAEMLHGFTRSLKSMSL